MKTLSFATYSIACNRSKNDPTLYSTKLCKIALSSIMVYKFKENEIMQNNIFKADKKYLEKET